MQHAILLENQTRRVNVPVFRLICFAMFTAWQMGFIYFMGPALVVNDRTPLPIDMDNVSSLIAAAYVLSILYMIVLPHGVVWAQRSLTLLALLTILGLFLPLSAGQLEVLIYLHIFCCCIMIGFESFLIANLLSEKSAIQHLTIAYGCALFIIVAVQNDSVPLTFSLFRPIVVIMLLMQLYFFFTFPAGRMTCPRYVKKGDGLLCPKHLFTGLCITSFVSCLLMLCGPAAVAEIPNGVALAYLADGFGSLLLYILYKKTKVHPLRWTTMLMGGSVFGYLFLFASSYIPALIYPSCILIGMGFVPCQFLPLYALVLLKNYPSRYIVPAFVSLALVTVVIQSTLVELFRDNNQMLLLIYLLIMIILTTIYLQLEPFLVVSLQKKFTSSAAQTEAERSSAPSSVRSDKSSPEAALLAQLTAREREVLDLISYGYSNGDISKILFLSEHTVKDYTKKIYRKLDVHSRHAAAQLVLRNQPEEDEEKL